MTEVRALDWIQSSERVRFERRIVMGLKPAIWSISRSAQLLLRMSEADQQHVRPVARALIPTHPYTAYKLGNGGAGGMVSMLLEKSMLDELPHLEQVEAGEASLIGPRATTPEHRANLFAVLENDVAEEWESILLPQKPGLLSTYALPVHRDQHAQQIPDSEMSEEELYRDALARYRADRHDFMHASKEHDVILLRQFVSMVLSRATGGRIG